MPGKRESMEIWKNYFIQSKILNDVQRCLLYFNLPFEIVKDEIKPEHHFEIDLRHSTAKATNHMSEMLQHFTRKRDENIRRASIILLQVPNRQQDPGRARPEDCQIIGGYASHEWATSQELLDGASNSKDDDSCFLFNLTQNLRFNAVSNRGPYQMVDKVSDSRRILFGREALCIENDFRRLTSRIGSVHDPNTQFSFGDDLM